MTLSMADIVNAAGLGVAVMLSLGVMLVVLWRPWRPARKPDLVLPTEAAPPSRVEAQALQTWLGSLAPTSGAAAARAATDTSARVIPLFADGAAPGGPNPPSGTQPLRRRA